MTNEHGSATIKAQLGDWRVYEQIDTVFAGTGEHAYFYIEKQGRNSEDVAQELARQLGLPRVAIGYAGKKDRAGITRQWMSAHTPSDRWPELDGVSCLKATRHTQKLKTGALSRNQFHVMLRDCQSLGQDQLKQLSAGFANRFGPQRFAGENLQQALTWLDSHRRGEGRRNSRARGKRKRSGVSRGQEGWHLSVLRSFLFNQILEYRSQTIGCERLIDGDFLVYGYPSAPLWGRGRSSAQLDALALERAALREHLPICEALEFTGVAQMRRALYVRPQGLTVEQVSTDRFRLAFTLPPGAYATTMLAHGMRVHDASLKEAA